MVPLSPFAKLLLLGLTAPLAIALGLMAGALPDDRELPLQILTELRGPRVAAAFACGSLLVLADALARTVIAPRELPVGVLTALLGVPLMLWLLRKP